MKLRIAPRPRLLLPPFSGHVSRRPSVHHGRRRLTQVWCSGHVKTAVRGTYWWDGDDFGDPVRLDFFTDGGLVTVEAQEGENILRLAEKYEAVRENRSFCYEGTCELCMMEVEGVGEVGPRKDPEAGEFVRTCITPVPASSPVKAKVLDSEEDPWSSDFV